MTTQQPHQPAAWQAEQPTVWQPAFPGQRAPFAPGNLANLRHGVDSARLVADTAGRIRAELDAEVPGWWDAVDRSAAEAWLTAEAKCRRLRSWLEDREPLTEDGKPWPAEDLLLRWERRAADARSRLGLDPLARSRLGRDTAAARVDLARLMGDLTDAPAADQPSDDHQPAQDDEGPR